MEMSLKKRKIQFEDDPCIEIDQDMIITVLLL